MASKKAWTMRRGYAAGGKSVAKLGSPPKGPAQGAKKSSAAMPKPKK